MAEKTKDQNLDMITADDVVQMYKNKEISAADRNYILRQKGHRELTKLIEDKGYIQAILERTVKHANEGWDNIVKAAQHDTTPTISNKENLKDKTQLASDVSADVKRELYYAGMAMWGQVQILTSIFSAFGEVNGQKAEMMLLGAGANPSVARIANFAVDVGSGFVPWGTFYKYIGKGAQALAGTASTVSASGKAVEAVGAAEKGTEEIKVAAAILDEGLKLEGIAPKFQEGLAKAQEVLGKIEGLAKEVTPSQIQKSMERVTSTASDLKLPQVLANAKPRYNIGVKEFIPQFTSDLDKALYIIAQKTPSKANESYMKLIRDFMPGVSDAVIEGMGRQVRSHIKELAKATETTGELLIPKSFTYETFKLAELAKTAIKGGEVEQLAFAKYATELFTNAPSTDKMKYSKEFVHMLNGWDPESMAKGDIAGAMRRLAIDMSTLYEKRNQLRRFIIDSQGGFLMLDRNWWGMAREGFQNMLLPFAWGGAFIGNSYATGLSVLTRATGALFSASDKGLINKEAYYQIKGMTLAIGDGLKMFGQAYGPKAKEFLGTRLDFPDPAIPGRVGEIIRGVGYDTMRGLDNFYKMIDYRGALYARYIREADQLGLKGIDMGNYVLREMSGPPTKEAFREASEIAMRDTFQGTLSSFTQKVNSILQTGPGVLYFPFMKSYANGIKYAWNTTPVLQLTSTQLYRDLAAGGVAGDFAIGKLTMSMMMGEFYARLAMEGYITGIGPVNVDLNRTWRTTHEPYSVPTPKGWMPLINMEPGNTNVGMIANVVQVLDQLDDVTAGQAFMAIAFSIMHDFADKTSWQNASNIIDAIQGLKEGKTPGGKPEYVLEQPITTAITLGPVGSRITQAIDPVRRDTHGFVNNILAKTPWVSKDQPALKDGYGDEVIPPTGWIPGLGNNSWFGLLRPVVPAFKPYQTDPIKIEGDRVQAKLPTFPYSFGGSTSPEFDIKAPTSRDRPNINLTPTQRDRWIQIYKNIIRHPDIGINKIVINSPHYMKDVATGEPTTLPYQSQMFSDYLSDAKQDAWDALVLEDKKLGDKILINDFTHVAPMLNRMQRLDLEKQQETTLQQFEKLRPEALQNLMKYGVLDTPSLSDSPALPERSPQQELKPNMELKLEMNK